MEAIEIISSILKFPICLFGCPISALWFEYDEPMFDDKKHIFVVKVRINSTKPVTLSDVSRTWVVT